MERVLVIPAEDILGLLGASPRGFHPGLEAACFDLVDRSGAFVERGRAETDAALKQVIPYGVLFCRGQVLLLERSTRGGDPRLRQKSSLGVGGHINPGDAEAGLSLRHAVGRAFDRELHEELAISCRYHARPIGLLNDDSNSVGQVHIGVVYRVELDEPHVSVRESERLAGALVAPEEVCERQSRLETWSSLLAAHLWPGRFPPRVS